MGGVRIFEVFGIPVHISLWFLLIVGWLGMGSGSIQTGVMWAGILSASILVHELGHGLVARHFGLGPSIYLHGFGGLCAHARAQRDRDDLLIIVAGPGAGLALGFIVWITSSVAIAVSPELATFGMFETAVRMGLYVNIVWSLVNLLPMWPLDGGQLFRLAMVRWFGAGRGERYTHLTGAFLGLFLCYAAYSWFHMGFAAALAGLLAYQNYRRLNAPSASGPIRATGKTARAIFDEAKAAVDAGDLRLAVRKAHQVRDQSFVDAKTLEQTWALLAVASAELGDIDAAIHYAERAPLTPGVLEVRITGHLIRGEVEAARAALALPIAAQLDPERRAAIEDALSI